MFAIETQSEVKFRGLMTIRMISEMMKTIKLMANGIKLFFMPHQMALGVMSPDCVI